MDAYRALISKWLSNRDIILFTEFEHCELLKADEKN